MLYREGGFCAFCYHLTVQIVKHNKRHLEISSAFTVRTTLEKEASQATEVI